MNNQAQLIAYVDRLTGGTFRDLQQLLDGPLEGAFGGVHVLPFFLPIDGSDAGFDPIDHTQVDPRLGTWEDVAALAGTVDVIADVIVNHVSSRSPRFLDYHRHGATSRYAGMFLTYDHVFPGGARQSDLLVLRSPGLALPFTAHHTSTGESVLLWTTFTREQVDIDVHHPESRRYLSDILERLGAAGIRAIRLDAVGFAIKKAGTSCFMIPETFAFIADLTAQARARGIEVLVEVHGHYREQMAIAARVDWVYDFALPPLVLHTIYTRNATHLKHWLDVRPQNAITVLDTHDGIGVQDVDAGPAGATGLLSPEEIAAVIETIHARSGDDSRRASGTAASNVDASQINCTYYDALGRADAQYLVARAIQCCVPGIPQIYYVGLLAGGNDLDLLDRTGVGRDVNRHYYTAAELQQELERPVVQSLLSLLRLRNTHPAFAGTCHVVPSPSDALVLEWTDGDDFARLDVNLTRMDATLACSNGSDAELQWRALAEARM